MLRHGVYEGGRIVRRRGILALAVAVVCGVATAGELIYHDTIRPTVFDEEWKEHVEVDFWIGYDTSTRELVFHASGGKGDFGFALDRTEADSLMSIIDKYKRWNLQASGMKVELEKEIAPLHVSRTFWTRDGRAFRGTGTEISVYFLSQTEQKHLLVLTFPALASARDARETFEAAPLYFDWKSALELRHTLEDEVVKAFLARPKSQKEIEAQFK
jgi:hypothetical protein